jgi:hypothetical protein
MPQTDLDWPLSFALFGQKLGRKQRGSTFRQLPSLRLSCRRSGRSPALPYPPHECLLSIMLSYPSFAKGTFLLCQKRGHFYFGLTEFSASFSGGFAC